MCDRVKQLVFLFGIGSILCVLVGCPPQRTVPPADSGGSNVTTPNVETLDTEAGDADDTEGLGDEPEPDAGAAVDAADSSNEAGQVILLGSPELTAGIPGDEPLSVQQIRDWIGQPENHEPLSIKLPLGMSLAAGQVQIPADNPLTRAKIELGRQLYFDTRMSGDNTIACASCHHPDNGYTRQTPFGVGIDGKTGNRNSPVSFNRLLSSKQFWDGRAASLEDQAKGPIANPIEHGTTHEEAVAAIAAVEGYVIQFETIFGPDSVNIDNIARSIASFERVIVTGPSPFDYYEQFKPFLQYDEEDLAEIQEDDPELYAKYEQVKAAAEANPMSESAVRGRDLFFSEKVGCTACHAGANFTDEKYHNLGVGMDKEEPDLGRIAVTNEEKDRGAFKTPTVRNITATAPYMHDGSQKTLEEVVEWYAKGGHPHPQLSDKIKKLDLTAQDKQDLVDFMRALDGPFPQVETARIP